MLKKVYSGAVIPSISLLLTPHLSVIGMTLLLLLVTIMEFFRSGFCEKKLLLNEKGFLCVFYKNIFCLFLGFDGASNMVLETFSE